MPKKIGGRIYCHKKYIQFLPTNITTDIVSALKVAERVLGGFEWNTVRVKPDGVGGAKEVTFQYSPDFDTADEPQVVKSYVLKNDGTEWDVAAVRDHKDLIWHHKWMWVGPNYKGFDYEASKARSALWKPHVSKDEIHKIGNKKFWDTIRKRWET